MGELRGGSRAGPIDKWGDEVFGGKNKFGAFFCFGEGRLGRGAAAGRDYRHKYRSSGIVRGYGFKKARAFFYGVRRHAMSDVHDAGVGGDAEHDGLADGYGVIGRAEVSHEDDGGTPTGWGERRGS